MKPLDDDLIRAAEILEETAQALKESNAVGDRQWVAPPECAEFVDKDRADHDEMLRIAKVLRRHAAYIRPNPLGGPASVFDVMANRIRAGEAFDDVLSDYGSKKHERRRAQANAG